MSAAALLAKLDKVRKVGAGWVACCPAHADKTPSLAITETDDGKVLVHCFAECGIDAIAAAVGIDLSEFFPPNLNDHRGKPLPTHKRFDARAVLACVSEECLIAGVLTLKIAQGTPLTHKEMARLHLASDRLYAARDLTNG